MTGKEKIDKMRTAYASALVMAQKIVALEPVFDDCCTTVEQAIYGTDAKPKDKDKGDTVGETNPTEKAKMREDLMNALEPRLGAIDGSGIERFMQGIRDAEIGQPDRPDHALIGIVRLIWTLGV